jgi:hypothetical protein
VCNIFFNEEKTKVSYKIDFHFFIEISCIKKMSQSHLILNRTTSQYVETVDENELQSRLWELLEVMKPTESWFGALTKDDLGQSHWKRTDHIVFVPPHLNEYVKRTYNELNAHNFNPIFRPKMKKHRHNLMK